MIKRRGDTTRDPPGGRAAERLRMFTDARRPKMHRKKRKRATKGPKKPAPANRGGRDVK